MCVFEGSVRVLLFLLPVLCFGVVVVVMEMENGKAQEEFAGEEEFVDYEEEEETVPPEGAAIVKDGENAKGTSKYVAYTHQAAQHVLKLWER